MKHLYKFFFGKELSNFDLIGVLFITYFALNFSLWYYLMLIPFILFSAVLSTHFEVVEKLKSE